MGKSSASNSPLLSKRGSNTVRPRIASLVLDTLTRRLSVSPSPSSASLAGAEAGSSLRDLRLRQRRSSVTTIPDIDPIPHAGLAKSWEWASIQNAIWAIFNSHEPSSLGSATVYKSVRCLSQTELGPFIYDYYRNKLMPKGMQHLAETVKTHEEGEIKALEYVWDKFYMKMLSNLKMVLHLFPIKEHNIRQLTLLGFRDYVLLQTGIEKLFEDEDLEVTPTIQQMLLVLQSIRISDPPSENFIRLERLVGRVVNPYIGYLGIYEGSSEPTIRSVNYFPFMRESRASAAKDDISVMPIRWRPRRSTISDVNKLETVKEMSPREIIKFRAFHLETEAAASPPVAVRRLRDDKGRRHSCDILF